MNRPGKYNIKWNPLALAFAVPCVGMLIVMLISQYEPFGKYSMLYSDMFHQYYPFFVAFRDALRSGQSLLHSWSVGLGMDYLGLISYYLASPLNLLSVLVPEIWLLEYFSLLVPLKLGFAGLFFAIFLKKMFEREDLSIAVFGAFYALCAWALGYQWNVMWLDTFALLPLVALGTVSLLRDRKFILYTATLAMSVFANYYIGFFTCIFVLLLFFVYEICRWQGFKRFFLDLGRIACFSVLAIGMTAILELPAYAALQTTQSSVNQFPKGFRMNIADENTWKGLLEAMKKVAGNTTGCIEPTFKEGLPNLYCGTGSLMLAFLYLTSRNVKLRDKICSVLLLIFFMLSFILRQLDYIWHGFHFTNMIPYRFSFLFSFVLLYMAYRAWLMRHQFEFWQILTAMLLTIAMIACNEQMTEWLFLLYNLGFLLLYGGILIYERMIKPLPEDADHRKIRRQAAAIKARRQLCGSLLLGVMVLELTCTLINFGIHFDGTSVSNYPRGTTYTASVIRYMKEREEDTLFYRAETTHSQTLNDGALNGYNGVSAFTSSANVKVTQFMQTLGYGAKNTYNRYCYEEASPVSNLFLNLKYMIERQGKDKASTHFKEINRFGDAVLLQNNDYLPLGFLTETALKDLEFDVSNNGFHFQNELLSTATGLQGDVWRVLTGDSLAIEGFDVTIEDQNTSGYCSYTADKSNSVVVYTYYIDTDGFMCISANLPKRNDVAIWVNGEHRYTEATSLPQMLAVGDVVMGDIVEVKMTCKNEGESSTMTISAAVLNEERFAACYDVLNTSTMELTKFTNTEVKGTVNCDRDGLLYTSIPQNGNWFAQVDGENVETVTVGNAMTVVELTEGSHEIRFYYRNKAFAMGWKITLVCVAIFALLVWRENRPAQHTGKYQNKKKEKH